MKISLDEVSKKFQQQWIFKRVSKTFVAPQKQAILGANGSGKSTLLRIIAGIQTPSKGKVLYNFNDKILAPTAIFKHIAYCAPGMEIVEEMTLLEFLNFHFTFKKPYAQLSVLEIINIIGLKEQMHRQVEELSSGMKQRVKLAQAIFSDTKILLLDEPCTNLDAAGVAQYLSWMEQFTSNRLVIIASNDPREYAFCNEVLNIEHYK